MERLLAVMRRLGHHFSCRSAEFDLSSQQANALSELAKPLPMGELADRLFCDASNVTGIVDRLESRGLLERQADPADRRVRRLVLTPTGQELWQAHHDRVFHCLPAVSALTGEERRKLVDLLDKMLA